MDEYIVVQISNNTTQAAADLNDAFGDGYAFVAWLIPPQPITPGQAIFRLIAA